MNLILKDVANTYPAKFPHTYKIVYCSKCKIDTGFRMRKIFLNPFKKHNLICDRCDTERCRQIVDFFY